MSKRVGKFFYASPQADAVCDLCGKTAELRPYGPNGENICYECGMKNEAATKAAFLKLLDGADAVIVGPAPEIAAALAAARNLLAAYEKPILMRYYSLAGAWSADMSHIADAEDALRDALAALDEAPEDQQ